MKHGQKARSVSGKVKSAKASKEQPGEKLKGKTAAAGKASSKVNSDAKAKVATKAGSKASGKGEGRGESKAGGPGREKEAASRAKASSGGAKAPAEASRKGRPSPEVTQAVTTPNSFGNPLIAAAFKRAVKKFSSALKRLND